MLNTRIIGTVTNIYLNYFFFFNRLGSNKPKPTNFKSGSRMEVLRKDYKYLSNEVLFSRSFTFFRRSSISPIQAALGFFKIKRGRKKKNKNLVKYHWMKHIFNVKDPVSLINFRKWQTVHSAELSRSRENFILNQRTFPTVKNIRKGIWEFFYRASYKLSLSRDESVIFQELQKTQSKLLFFNAHKPLIWKMRKARYTHWGLRTFGKLNEWRYDKLIGWELRKLVKNRSKSLLSYIILRTYSAVLSWRQMFLLAEFNLIIVNGVFYKEYLKLEVGDIVELPFRVTNITPRELFEVKKNFSPIIYRAKLVAYKSFLRRTNPYVSKNQQVPKIFKKLPLGYSEFGLLTAYDITLNIFAILRPINHITYDVDYNLTYNSVLTLQNWRFRFD